VRLASTSNDDSLESDEDRRTERRFWTSRIIRRGDDSNAFDREYWAALSGEERVAYGWQMTVAQFALKGISEDQLCVQRSVARVERRGR
jgi:hypothetical protein